MIQRSKEFWLAAFFLSKYGTSTGKKDKPPIELETQKWNEAYRMFYESLGQGRTIEAFEHSLKNARDAYDSHFENSTRIGWRDKERKPANFNKVAKGIFEKYSTKDRRTIWNDLKSNANKNIAKYESVIEDLISIQLSENDTEIISKTEGGKKVVVSYRYERNPSLRNDAFKIHGYDCAVCGFNFLKMYGTWGKGFGEVHHVEPLSIKGEVKKQTNPKTDLIIVCANCHRMIHRKKGITLTVGELKLKIKLER